MLPKLRLWCSRRDAKNLKFQCFFKEIPHFFTNMITWYGRVSTHDFGSNRVSILSNVWEWKQVKQVSILLPQLQHHQDPSQDRCNAVLVSWEQCWWTHHDTQQQSVAKSHSTVSRFGMQIIHNLQKTVLVMSDWWFETDFIHRFCAISVVGQVKSQSCFDQHGESIMGKPLSKHANLCQQPSQGSYKASSWPSSTGSWEAGRFTKAGYSPALVCQRLNVCHGLYGIAMTILHWSV